MLVAVVSFVAISLPLLLDILLCCVTLGGLFWQTVSNGIQQHLQSLLGSRLKPRRQRNQCPEPLAFMESSLLFQETADQHISTICMVDIALSGRVRESMHSNSSFASLSVSLPLKSYIVLYAL